MMLASSIRAVLVALVLAVAFSLFWSSAWAAQGGLQLPSVESFKEIEIVGGERLVFAGGRMKSLEDSVELVLIPTSEDDENLRVKADRIDFSYDEKAETPTLLQVVAEGNVSLATESGKDQLLADKLIWSVAENKAELRGDPKAITEQYTLSGESIVYYIGEGRGEVMKPRGTFVIPEKKDSKEETKKEEKTRQ